jgi:hypothetical protein
MMVNRLIDTLVAKRSHQFMVMPGLKEGPEYYADLLRRAEKFDFGALDNVLIKASDEEGRWSTPVLTAEENRFIDEGLVPLPAPLVWYEYVLNGKASGVIIEDNPQLGWCVNRIDYDRATGKGILDGVWVRFNKNHGAPNPNPALKFLYQIKHVPGAEPANTGCVMVDPTDCSLILAECSSDFYRTDPTFDPLKFEEDFGIASHMQFARYLTLMINSKTTSMEYVADQRARTASRVPARDHCQPRGHPPVHCRRRARAYAAKAALAPVASQALQGTHGTQHLEG